MGLRKNITATMLLAVFSIVVNAGEMPTAFWQEQTAEYNSHQIVSLTGANEWQGIFNAITDAPQRVVVTADARQAIRYNRGDDALSILNNNSTLFGISSDQLEILHHGDVLGKEYLTARQLIDNRPVLSTLVQLRLSEQGDPILWGSDIVESEGVVWDGTLTESQAADYLAEFSGVSDHQTIEAVEFWVRHAGILTPAYYLKLAGASADERPVGLVSAWDGEIIGFYNHVFYADIEGMVDGPYLPRRFDDEPVWGAYPFINVDAGPRETYAEDNGEYRISGLNNGQQYNISTRLTGRWIQVVNDDGLDARHTDNVTAPWVYDISWEEDEGHIDEFNLYYHGTFIHEYYKDLDPDFDEMDESILSVRGYGTNYENAFWNGEGMFFGTGGGTLRNLALFNDVILHEYTHGVTGRMYPRGTLPYSGQSGAMNEAWSDFFTCSIHDESAMSRGVYVGSPMQAMRDLDNNKRMPDHWVGEVHADGEIFGGAMWDVRSRMGAEAAEELMHFAKYGFAENFQSYLVEVLTVDDDNGDLSDGTPNADAIYYGFGRHGIGPGEEPNLVLEAVRVDDENGDNEFAGGESGEILLVIENDVVLFPPPAENVTVTISADAYIEFENNDVVLGNIEAGQRFAMEEPIRFTVAEDVWAQFMNLRIQLSANDGDYLVEFTQRITLGDPRILVVDDGGQQSFQDFFVRPLIRLWTAGNLVDVSADGLPSEEYMAEHDIVIWHTGNARNPLTPNDVGRLETFIEDGGNLILTGQFLGAQMNMYPAFFNMLGVEGSVDPLQGRALFGVENDPFSDGKSILLTGPGEGAGNQTDQMGVYAADDARELYRYYPGDESAVIWKEQENGNATAFFAFGIEGITGSSISSSSDEVLRPLIEGMGLILDVKNTIDVALPVEFSVLQPYPNPFNPSVQLEFSLPSQQDVLVTVHNVLGQEVLRLMDGQQGAGLHNIQANMAEMSSGLYLFRVQTQDAAITRKAMLLK
ncbi:T9SS type A sorting domain-containing protein [bacterium]|nr:T9SS type A sorting domain-containing protein [bacterium]